MDLARSVVDRRFQTWEEFVPCFEEGDVITLARCHAVRLSVADSATWSDK